MAIVIHDYTVTVADIPGGHRLTATRGSEVQTVDVVNKSGGGTGGGGADGFSPIIEITEISGGHRLTVTDANGTKSFDVLDGAAGATGPAGADGAPGKTAYQYAQDGGYTGSEAEFAVKLAKEIPDPYTLPVATADTLGGVKVGEGLEIDGGVLGIKPGNGLETIDVILIGYRMLTEKPADWETNWKAYYNYEPFKSDAIRPITVEACPAWESGKYCMATNADDTVVEVYSDAFKGGPLLNLSCLYVLIQAPIERVANNLLIKGLFQIGLGPNLSTYISTSDRTGYSQGGGTKMEISNNVWGLTTYAPASQGAACAMLFPPIAGELSTALIDSGIGNIKAVTVTRFSPNEPICKGTVIYLMGVQANEANA